MVINKLRKTLSDFAQKKAPKTHNPTSWHTPDRNRSPMGTTPVLRSCKNFRLERAIWVVEPRIPLLKANAADGCSVKSYDEVFVPRSGSGSSFSGIPLETRYFQHIVGFAKQCSAFFSIFLLSLWKGLSFIFILQESTNLSKFVPGKFFSFLFFFPEYRASLLHRSYALYWGQIRW